MLSIVDQNRPNAILFRSVDSKRTVSCIVQRIWQSWSWIFLLVRIVWVLSIYKHTSPSRASLSECWLVYEQNGPAWTHGTGKRFFTSAVFPDRLWGPRGLVFHVYQSSFPRINRPGREVTSNQYWGCLCNSWRGEGNPLLTLMLICHPNSTFLVFVFLSFVRHFPLCM